MSNQPASQLMSAANQLRLKEGASKTAGRLISTAAMMLLLSGVSASDLNERLADAIRDFDGDDTGARH